MKKINIDDLKEDMVSNQTIFNERGTILVAQGVSLTDSIIKRLKKINIAFVDIKDEDEVPANCSTSTHTAKQAIAAVADLSEGLFALKTINVRNNLDTIEKVVHSVLERPFIQEFLEGCAGDQILYKHSLRTAILSTNLGLIKGYDELNLQYLAMSAIVHDCGMGKKFIEDEDHALQGFIKLRENLDVDMVIALVCLQHHERYDGHGFPFSCGRTQISEFARLLAVVDHYDRLLMYNSDPRKALFDTIGQKNVQFDPSMIELFAATIDWPRIYNIHSTVPNKK